MKGIENVKIIENESYCIGVDHGFGSSSTGQ
jgi:hypothetical protein